jgi:hypothetical protein
METDTSDSGRRIKCKGMEFTDGQMEESIMGSGSRINKMDTDI